MPSFSLAPDLLVTIKVSGIKAQAAVEEALSQIEGVELVESKPVEAEEETKPKRESQSTDCAEERAKPTPQTLRGRMFRLSKDFDAGHFKMKQHSTVVLKEALEHRFQDVERIPGDAIWQVVLDTYGYDQGHRYKIASGRSALSVLRNTVGYVVPAEVA